MELSFHYSERSAYHRSFANMRTLPENDRHFMVLWGEEDPYPLRASVSWLGRHNNVIIRISSSQQQQNTPPWPVTEISRVRTIPLACVSSSTQCLVSIPWTRSWTMLERFVKSSRGPRWAYRYEQAVLLLAVVVIVSSHHECVLFAGYGFGTNNRDTNIGRSILGKLTAGYLVSPLPPKRTDYDHQIVFPEYSTQGT
jgi:hypothetical protein